MNALEHPLRTGVLNSMEAFNSGVMSGPENFAPDLVFTVPGRSAVAGIYRGREGFGDFLGRLQALSGGTFRIEPNEVLTNDDRMVLFLRFTALRGTDELDVLVAGFHSDRGPEGWRKATFLPDDIAVFDRFFPSQ